MIAKNFSFHSEKWNWLKAAVNMSIITTRDENRSSIFSKEKLLAERIVEGENGVQRNAAKGWQTWFEKHSESSRAAVVITEGEQDNYHVMAPMWGYDVVFVQERFLTLPVWWSFSNVERGSLLAYTVELLKQAGLIAYFDALHESKWSEVVEASAKREVLEEDESHGIDAHETADGFPTVTLEDSLVRESLMPLLYGTAAATLALVGEMIAKLCMEVFCAFQNVLQHV